jgi:hypothetical protein
MTLRIISGGQTGVDRAALDVALAFGLPYGGWLPKGRRTEDGALPDTYKMKEMPTADYSGRTEQNVIDSQGTLIICRGKPKGGTELTQALAVRHHRPCLHVDPSSINVFQAAKNISTWISQQGIEVLNVAGPRNSEDPEIYTLTVKILKAVFYMNLINSNMPDGRVSTVQRKKDGIAEHPHLPQTVEQAVNRLISSISLKDRTMIAYMKEEELISIYPSLGGYIRDRYGLSTRNKELMESCRVTSKVKQLENKAAFEIIIHELWEKLQKTHTLRIVE